MKLRMAKVDVLEKNKVIIVGDQDIPDISKLLKGEIVGHADDPGPTVELTFRDYEGHSNGGEPVRVPMDVAEPYKSENYQVFIEHYIHTQNEYGEPITFMIDSKGNCWFDNPENFHYAPIVVSQKCVLSALETRLIDAQRQLEYAKSVFGRYDKDKVYSDNSTGRP